MTKTAELWAPMPKEPFTDLYEISSLGRVRTVKTGRIRKAFPDHHGYWQIRLKRGGMGWTGTVHRLVAMAFIPNPDHLPVVNHIDHNPANCAVSNLEWCTYAANTQDAIAKGFHSPARVGSAHGRTHLTEADVLNIRADYPAKTQATLAAAYGVSVPTIQAITSRRNWRHV